MIIAILGIREISPESKDHGRLIALDLGLSLSHHCVVQFPGWIMKGAGL